MYCALFPKLGVIDEKLLAVTAGLPWTLTGLRDWDVCALAWAYQVLDPSEQHKSFQVRLCKEVSRRNLTQAQVVRSQHGYEEWEACQAPHEEGAL